MGATDPLRAALADAAEDDEPSGSEEASGAAEGWAEYRRGDYLTADEAKRQLLGQ